MSAPIVHRGRPSVEVSQERRNRVVIMTRAGMPAPEIATRLGITTRSVQRIRRACGISQPVPAPLSDEELATAKALFDDGASRLEVARTIGRNTSAVERAFPGRCWTPTEQNEYLAHIRLWRRLVSA